MDSMIQVKEVNFFYESENRSNQVLYDLNLNINKGEFVAVLGHNGSGKSTLAKQFNAILIPTSGTVIVEGIDTSKEELVFEVRQKVGMVFQNPDNQIVATIVEEDVAFAPENLGVPPKEIRERVDRALKEVDMYEYKDRAPHQLSGGQKQRVAIAGIIAMQPDCIVLDEATAMLDPKGRREVLNTIQRLNRELGTTIIHITHYMEEAVLADRVVVIDNGKLLMDGTPSEVFCRVEELKKVGLDVPQVTELIDELNREGIEIGETVLTCNRCVELLSQLLGESKHGNY